MKKLTFIITVLILLHESCQSQPVNTDKVKNKIIYKCIAERFLLLDSSINKIDTVFNFPYWAIDDVIDVYAFNDKCLLIYRGSNLIAFNSFEKKFGKWEPVIGRQLLVIHNQTGLHEFKIVDERHIRVKERATKKVKLYELDYLEKKMSFTETIDQ
jgi:hypothetical protein